jgi:hypothetical protein
MYLHPVQLYYVGKYSRGRGNGLVRGTNDTTVRQQYRQLILILVAPWRFASTS